MGQEGLTFMLVLGTGALLLRPGDFPLFARAGGRLVGLTVRSIRTTKEAAEKAITKSASAHQQNPEMVAMRENIQQSLEKFHDLTNTVRRDMADVPLNPASLFTKGLRSWDEQVQNQNGKGTNLTPHAKRMEKQILTTTPRTTHPQLNVAENVQHLQPPHAKPLFKHSDPSVSGGDLLSRAIEEHALALQKQRLFTHTHIPSHSTNTNRPANDSADA